MQTQLIPHLKDLDYLEHYFSGLHAKYMQNCEVKVEFITVRVLFFAFFLFIF